jgi:transcriptional regulator with XRE-family HTH domain
MKFRRKQLGLSAEYVAEKLGVSPATIYRYENGEINKVPGDRLYPIAAVLSTTPDYLMGWSDSPVDEKTPTPVSEDGLESEVMRNFEVLSPERQREALSYLRYLAASEDK